MSTSVSFESGLAFVQRLFSSRDALVPTALLLLSLAFAHFKLRRHPHPDLAAKVPFQKGISEETKMDWRELRACDVSNVRVSQILIHPIKVT